MLLAGFKCLKLRCCVLCHRIRLRSLSFVKLLFGHFDDYHIIYQVAFTLIVYTRYSIYVSPYTVTISPVIVSYDITHTYFH